MRTKKAAFYLLAVLLGGCLPSLHPLYTDDTLIFEEKLLGKWIEEDGDVIWEFKKAGEQEYEMRVLDGKEGRFEAHLIKLEDMMFLDIFPDDEMLEEMQDFYKFHILPVHTFMKVEQIDPNLQLRMMNPEKVSDMLKDDPNLLKHEFVDDSIVLTASTKELQEFVTKYANTEDVFGDASDMTRLEPLYTDEDVVFDENLIGEWEGEDGQILDSIKMGEKAYDMIFIEQDGTEHQFFANMVGRNGTTFLAVFFDKSELDPNDYSAFHLIPDRFLQIDQIKPKLLLRELDYEEVSEMLKQDAESLKQEAVNADYIFEGVRIEP